VALTCWIVVGSYVFGSWWYGFFWDDGFRHPSYVKRGLQILIDEYYWWVLLILGVTVIAVFLASLFRRGMFMFIDKGPWLIVFCTVMVTVSDALILRHTQRIFYETLKTDEDTRQRAVQFLSRLAEPPDIRTPIHFYFVEPAQVDSLYNQIAPEHRNSQ